MHKLACISKLEVRVENVRKSSCAVSSCINFTASKSPNIDFIVNFENVLVLALLESKHFLMSFLGLETRRFTKPKILVVYLKNDEKRIVMEKDN